MYVLQAKVHRPAFTFPTHLVGVKGLCIVRWHRHVWVRSFCKQRVPVCLRLQAPQLALKVLSNHLAAVHNPLPGLHECSWLVSRCSLDA